MAMINPRMKLFFKALVEKGLVASHRESDVEDVWKMIQIGRPCTALITSSKRNGQVCGRACVKDEEHCVCHLPKEKREQMKAAALVNPDKIAKKEQKTIHKEMKKEQKKAEKEAAKLKIKAEKELVKQNVKLEKALAKAQKNTEHVTKKHTNAVDPIETVKPKAKSKKAKTTVVEYE